MTRIVSGVVMAVAVLALLLFGDSFMFFIFVELLIALCAWEMFCMLEVGSQPGLKYVGVALAVALGFAIYIGDMATIMIVLAVMMVSVPVTSFLRRDLDIFQASTQTVFPVVYIAVTLITLALIRNMDDGASYIIMVIAVNALCDTGAYYTGRTYGKTKLAPMISPGKTVEGFIGGAVVATLSAIVIALIFFPAITFVNALAIGLIAGFIGPAGDLFESSIKRKMGVKDSGSTIPGHGGVLDRVDSLMFTSAALYVYMELIITP